MTAPSVAWLVGVARHKLVDHWRRAAREERKLHILDGPLPPDDDWDHELEGPGGDDRVERESGVLRRTPRNLSKGTT